MRHWDEKCRRRRRRIEEEKRHNHKLSEVRAVFFGSALDTPPWRAEHARGGAGGAAGGAQRRSRKSARTSESL